MTSGWVIVLVMTIAFCAGLVVGAFAMALLGTGRRVRFFRRHDEGMDAARYVAPTTADTPPTKEQGTNRDYSRYKRQVKPGRWGKAPND